MLLLPCPLPFQSTKDSDSDKPPSHHFHSDSSSSNTSLSSQQSLPSIPSLTPPPQILEQTSTTFHHCITTLKSHSCYLFSLSLAGKHLYSGSSNSEIRVWSRVPSKQGNMIVPHNLVAKGSNSAVKSIVVLGDKLFSAHQDHKIRVWKIDNDTPHQKYKCIAILPTLNDRVIRLFSTKNYVKVRRHKKCTWVHHVDTISALALSSDGSLLYSSSWDRTFKIWKTSDFKCLESVWNAHDDAINTIVVSSDGFVYTGSADKTIKVWSPKPKQKQKQNQKQTLMATLEKHKSAVNALALSPDGSVMYSGACDRSIIVWEKDGSGGHMAVVGALRGHTKAILCLAVVSDLICSGSADKTVRIWRKGLGNSYTCLSVFEGHRGPVKCLTAAVDTDSSNGNNSSDSGSSYLVYSGSLDCDIKVWKVFVPFVE